MPSQMKVFDVGICGRYRLGLSVARVNKPLREEAAGAGRHLWGKSVAGWFCGSDRRDGVGGEGGRVQNLPEALVWLQPGKERFCAVIATFRTATDRRARPVLLKQPVYGGWDERAFGHAACFLGGARDRGTSPRRNVSMMRMGPPQQGQGSRRASGRISAAGASSCLFSFSPSNARNFEMLALRAALASRP